MVAGDSAGPRAPRRRTLRHQGGTGGYRANAGAPARRAAGRTAAAGAPPTLTMVSLTMATLTSYVASYAYSTYYEGAVRAQ